MRRQPFFPFAWDYKEFRDLHEGITPADPRHPLHPDNPYSRHLRQLEKQQKTMDWLLFGIGVNIAGIVICALIISAGMIYKTYCRVNGVPYKPPIQWILPASSPSIPICPTSDEP